MYLLKGVIQPYAWGGDSYLQNLLQVPENNGHPSAEYWLGVHPGGPSRVVLGRYASTTLTDLIRSEKGRYLGEKVNALFGGLPYLLKILDVKGMLSIQVHPTLEEAKKGFERENTAGIPLHAANRNYKDPNHKPEVMVALSDFWLLHGFNPALRDVLQSMDVFQPLLPILEAQGLEGLYRHVMEMPQPGVDEMLAPLAHGILPKYEAGELSRDSADFWAARVLSDAKPDLTNLDRGIFSIYFFNLLHLRPRQAIFQGAGIPHAYLEGQNVELMSNSDNVLRAGLTPKYIDIPELMRHTKFEYVVPEIMENKPSGFLSRYPCPVPDFSIDMLELGAGDAFSLQGDGPELWLQLSGRSDWSGYRTLQCAMGGAVFVLPGEPVTITALETTVLFRAYVP
jgi:mannose-6-phosphate isomerase